MRAAKHFSLGLGALAATLLAVACRDGITPPRADGIGQPSLHPVPAQCPIKKFTGGGRIDPVPPSTIFGKVTFGFNVHFDNQCNVIKGQIQVVHHPSQTKYHSVSIGPAGVDDDQCLIALGTVRVKHGNAAPEEHEFTMRACDKGEPGSQQPGFSSTGPDTFRWVISGGQVTPNDGHGDTGDTELTGGNIQAH